MAEASDLELWWHVLRCRRRSDTNIRHLLSLARMNLDGSHEPRIVWSEIERLAPRVVPGGFLVVDDTDWFDGAVRRRLDATGWNVRHEGKRSVVRVAGAG